MNTAITLATGALLLSAASASAQDVPHPLDPAHMDAPQAEAGGAAPEAAAQDFTDEEIAGFVEAATAIREMRDDATLDGDARQAQAETIVARHGLDPQTYNAIGVAAQSDPAVAQRVRLALAQLRENGES